MDAQCKISWILRGVQTSFASCEAMPCDDTFHVLARREAKILSFFFFILFFPLLPSIAA
jgi:hypothetical protein